MNQCVCWWIFLHRLGCLALTCRWKLGPWKNTGSWSVIVLQNVNEHGRYTNQMIHTGKTARYQPVTRSTGWKIGQYVFDAVRCLCALQQQGISALCRPGKVCGAVVVD
jgi:hypothetical protein